MKRKVNAPISTAVAIGVGIIVLVSYFFHNTFLDGLLQVALLPWAAALVAVAVWVGMFNLLAVHNRKITKNQPGAGYSFVLVLSLLITLAAGLFWGPQGDLPQRLFRYIQIPIEASLMAVLTISLAFASARLLYRRVNLLSAVFVITVLIVLLGSVPLPFGDVTLISDYLRPWIAQVPAAAGARGILLGVALGTIATGLRILMGADRPYRG